ncbi:hypothetical protein M6D81_13910 [Paenibacillus sp. J5C_2022]|uniref:hypothetical protein n=1 Tax=Paenibacillus sp. J5C2022 TaxID=2977129 RepID=UPI0021D01C15|nr:hypothetical protein [Paenibacillus sp. J5C2022]MCU6709788.1 hypothetical protein [Paenibacillus sp. J5C2022]
MKHARNLFQNTKRSDYHRHAEHSLQVRNVVAAASLDTEEAYGYFIERQAKAYGDYRSYGGVFQYHESPGPLILPTEGQRKWIERLADYVLAEDHVKGLTLRTKAHIKADEDEENPPVGDGARRYLENEYQRWCFMETMPGRQAKRVKTCEVCRCEFMDESRNGMAEVCGHQCRKRKDKVRKRLERHDSPELKRYRERQDYEYPFYSPVELFELSARGESVKAEPEKAIDERRIRQERGRRTPTNKSMDSDKHYSPNKHKRWRSEREAAELAGPVIAYNLNDASSA